MPTELEPIQSIPLDGLSEAVKEAEDTMASWKIVSNDFRILRHNGQVYGIIPTAKISVMEGLLFKHPKISTYAMAVNLLEGNNMEFFIMAAVQAKEEKIRISKG